MIQIESLILPDLVWTDKYVETGVETKTERTLTGRQLIWEQSVYGRPMTLEGSENSGWILKSNLDLLFAMGQIPNSYYELSFESEIFTVRFRNEEKPCIDAKPIVGRPNQADGDYFSNLIIKLMII